MNDSRPRGSGEQASKALKGRSGGRGLRFGVVVFHRTVETKGEHREGPPTESQPRKNPTKTRFHDVFSVVTVGEIKADCM